MPSTTAYSFGDIVLVPFPFTDQTGTKKRPAVIVSSNAYHEGGRDLVIMAVTTQIRQTPQFGEIVLTEWKKAGLLKSSVTKPILASIEKRLVQKKLGRLQEVDQTALQNALRLILG